jgi:hypothetical protein
VGEVADPPPGEEGHTLADPDGYRELLTANETGVLWTSR